MLYWLYLHLRPLDHGGQTLPTGDSPVHLTARTALAAVTAFLLAWWFGPVAIGWLKRRFRERIDSASERLNELHAAKNATPTMGGLFIVGAVILAALLFGDLTSPYVQQAVCLVAACGALGAADDWVKIRTAKRGLSARQKLLGQAAIAAVIAGWLYVVHLETSHGLDLVFPWGGTGVSLGIWLIPWSMLVLVGSSNGVNLTDGLDGLAGGCLVFAGAALCGLCYLAGHRVLAEYFAIPAIVGAGELCILFGALVGAMLGFLWYNCYPAEVFMGDTGSLPAGALLGYGALVARQELLLLVIGGVFVVETLSVILQVGWFRLTGQRLIACSPLHNHYLFRGDHETKIVVRFWISSALLALLAVASLNVR
jgi:phospho-N-acetylmuramoyl-pentapeptide-transferase